MPSPTYVGQTIILDGKCFEDVTFECCTFIYKGIDGVPLIGCRFVNPRFLFEGSAANTLALLSGLYADGFGEIVDASLNGQSASRIHTRH